MKLKVEFEVKDYIRNWSDQDIIFEYKQVDAVLHIKDTTCELLLDGRENIKDVFYIIWEILFLYDGYFYKPILYEYDGYKRECSELIRVPFYITDRKWYSSELLGRSQRNFSYDILSKYDKLRNTGISQKKMTKSVVNAFYYLHSENYGRINSNHLLSLLLNIADGFVINTFGQTHNVKASYDKLFKKTIDLTKLKQGITLLGLDEEKYKGLLTQERHTFDHYIFCEDSLSTAINNSETEIKHYVIWFFIYVMELVIRINILKASGVSLKQENIDYALQSINDWVIYENDLDIDCSTIYYKLKQDLKRLGITNS